MHISKYRLKTEKIGDNIALGLTYTIAAEAAGIWYQIFNGWHKKDKNSKSGEYFEFYKFIRKCNADAAKKCLEHLNEAAKAGDTLVCLWIIERRFSEDFSRRIYRKTNVFSENKNENVEIIVNDAKMCIRDSSMSPLSRMFSDYYWHLGNT